MSKLAQTRKSTVRREAHKPVLKPVLWLVIGLPAVSVLMGVVTLWLAFGHNDRVDVTEPPMSKTSWKQGE